jgi:hypothetical protein
MINSLFYYIYVVNTEYHTTKYTYIKKIFYGCLVPNTASLHTDATHRKNFISADSAMMFSYECRVLTHVTTNKILTSIS